MLDGKMLRGLTGTPMRRMHLANSSLAEAEPEPLMLANLTTKSLVAVSGVMTATALKPSPSGGGFGWGWVSSGPLNPMALPLKGREASATAALLTSRCHLSLRRQSRVVLTAPGIRFRKQEPPHVPRTGRAALGAQAAMQADVFVLGHHATGLDGLRHVQILLDVFRRCSEARAQIGFLAVGGERDAIHRAHIHAGVAFDADILREHRLHVAIQAALRLLPRGLHVEAQLDFLLDALECLFLGRPRHDVAFVRRDVVVVTPLVDAHLLRDEVG